METRQCVMNHADFVQAWRAGELRVEVDLERAGALLAARLLLPYVAIAVIGSGIALVLWGWIWSGLAVGAAGILAPRLIKKGAGGFLMAHIGQDRALYDDALRAGALRLLPNEERPAASSPGQDRTG